MFPLRSDTHPLVAARPLTRPSSAIKPLSQEEKDRLNAKYGQIKAPSPNEVAEIGKSCKMQ